MSFMPPIVSFRQTGASMKVLYDRSSVAGVFHRPKVTLGTFDGVHVGHQRVIHELINWARATDSPSLVITFDRKPGRVISGRPFDQIPSLPHRLRLLEALGVDGALVLEFDQALADMGAEEFVRDVLAGQLQIGGFLLGHDTRFGHDGRGDMDLLADISKRYNFEACSVPVVLMDGLAVSSTRVREAVKSGDLALAARLMGRRFSLLGPVVHGTSRGAGLGYPTANMELQHETRPPQGVYATRALLNGRWFGAVTNIGRPPTLRAGAPRYQSAEVVVETYVFDFSGDLYGGEIEVEFVERIRGEKSFTSTDALARQIAQDVEKAREVLNGANSSGTV